jgi:predicted HicB family RNase H-like nuclease
MGTDKMQTPLGTRVDDKLKAALQRAAKKEGRSLSNLVERILQEWVDARKKKDAEK